jgi:hypothetical protein
LLAVFDLKVFDAAVAALELVIFLGAFVCDNVDPAADLAALLAVLLLIVFDAAEAAFLLVTSLFAMIDLLIVEYCYNTFQNGHNLLTDLQINENQEYGHASCCFCLLTAEMYTSLSAISLARTFLISCSVIEPAQTTWL